MDEGARVDAPEPRGCAPARSVTQYGREADQQYAAVGALQVGREYCRSKLASIAVVRERVPEVSYGALTEETVTEGVRRLVRGLRSILRTG